MNQVSRRSLTPDQQALWLDAIRIADMPDLGAISDACSFVGEHAGSGRFGAAALKAYIGSGQLNLAGPVLIGTGTPSYLPNYAFQVAYDHDGAALGGNRRDNIFNTTLTYSSDTGNIWENLCSFVYVNGPGRANGEINNFHSFLQINAGAYVGGAEGYESSGLNHGHLEGYDAYLAVFDNEPGGTIQEYTGLNIYLVNNNPAPGSIAVWSGIKVTPMQGAGSRPTYYSALEITDPYAGIVTEGGILLGALGNATPGSFFIQGADNAGGTYPFTMKNLAGNILLAINNAGDMVGGLPGHAFTWAGPVAGSGFNAATGGVYAINSSQVVGARQTGFVGITGAANSGSPYDTATITLPQLAGRVAAIQAALMTHGLLGA